MSDVPLVRQFSDSAEAQRLRRRAQNLRVLGSITSHATLLLALALGLVDISFKPYESSGKVQESHETSS